MEIFKIVGFGLVICFVAMLIKQLKSEYYVPVIIVGSALILLYALSYFTQIFNLVNTIISKTGIDSDLFVIVLKIIGVGYLIEFTSSICVDSGNASIADKIILTGRIIILSMSLPIIYKLFSMVVELI